MAHGSDNQLDSQPESRVSNPGDAAMANTAAQTYSGGEFQSMSQSAYAQSAKDSQDMSKGPNATLGDLQITGSNPGRASDTGQTPSANSDNGAGAPPSAHSASDNGAGAANDVHRASDNGAGAANDIHRASDNGGDIPPGSSGDNNLAHSSGEGYRHPGSSSSAASGDAAGKNFNPNRERNFESWNGGQIGDTKTENQSARLADNQVDSNGDKQGDRQGDSIQSNETPERYGVPETQLPTPDQVKNAPVEQLQQMAAESRKATEDYIKQQGSAIPHLGFHGTTEGSAKGITNRPQGEIWVAGAKPEMTNQGVSQHVQALSDSTRISQGYADNPRPGSNGGPGPVLVFNTNNQPEAWQKTNGESGNAKYGKLDLQRGDLLGQVSREQLDSSKKELGPLHGALNEKGAEYQKQPGGLTESHLDEIRARGQAVESMHRDRELQMYLGVVAKSNAERGIAAQPEQNSGNQSFFSRMVSRFRGNSW